MRSDQHRAFTPGCATSSTFSLASQRWPSTLYSTLRLSTIFQAETSLDLRAYEAFPSEPTTRNSSLRALLHAFYSLTLLRKQASSSEFEPRLRGCEPSQSPYPSLVLLHTRKDRCSHDLIPSRSSPDDLPLCFHKDSSHGLPHSQLQTTPIRG